MKIINTVITVAIAVGAFATLAFAKSPVSLKAVAAQMNATSPIVTISKTEAPKGTVQGRTWFVENVYLLGE